jgi:hypothetical protein
LLEHEPAPQPASITCAGALTGAALLTTGAGFFVGFAGVTDATCEADAEGAGVACALDGAAEGSGAALGTGDVDVPAAACESTLTVLAWQLASVFECALQLASA